MTRLEEIKVAPATLAGMGECQNALLQEARDRFNRAGLSLGDAMTLASVQRKADALASLVTLLRYDSMLAREEQDRDEPYPPAGLNGFIRGGVEEAVDILVFDICGALCSLGDAT